MENLIVNSILTLEKFEKDHGKMGTLIALLILAISTITAIVIIGLTFKCWLSIVEYIFPKLFNGWTLR